jgi:hypothetical protein
MSATESKTNPKNEPQWYKVVSSFPEDRGRVLFRSVSEKRARNFVQNRFPRGSEAHLRLPNGQHEHYEAERQGEHGQDAEPWGPFDPDSWQPPAMQEPPGQSAWGDVEG